MTCFTKYIGFFSVFTIMIVAVGASIGDSTPFFKKCRENCQNFNCTSDGALYKPERRHIQPFFDRMFLWKCVDDCVYHCMWKTVDSFEERGWKMPQFFGKWPFLRVLGMQELGSVLGSFLNLIAHIVNYSALKRRISKEFSTFWLWQTFFFVCFNGWIWSVIFHTRDNDFTEFMDYACAFSMVVVVFYCFGMRILYEKSRKWRIIFSSLCVSYFINHTVYLYSGQIDYSYNMKANIVAGVLGGVGWATWCCVQFWRGRYYVWRCLAFVLLTAASLFLELSDFPPIMKFWDAHAIWHLSTAPLPFLFYRFIIDDCRQIRKKQQETQSNLKKA